MKGWKICVMSVVLDLFEVVVQEILNVKMMYQGFAYLKDGNGIIFIAGVGCESN